MIWHFFGGKAIILSIYTYYYLKTGQRVALKVLSPEQFRGQAVPATDLYGLGATLLFLLTHRSPADLPTDGLTIKFRSYVL